MESLKESLIEKVDHLPEASLREVMEDVTFLEWRGAGEDVSLLKVAGVLFGTPVSAE